MNISPQEIPKDSDYQLVRASVHGDMAMGEVSEMEKNGWRKVPRSRHPNLKSIDVDWLEDGGLVLMERPKYLTDRAKVWEQQKADAQIVAAQQEMAGHDVEVTFWRPVDPNATAERTRTIKEHFVLNAWRAKTWVRDKIAGRR